MDSNILLHFYLVQMIIIKIIKIGASVIEWLKSFASLPAVGSSCASIARFYM
jgi:hypothetical protein